MKVNSIHIIKNTALCIFFTLILSAVINAVPVIAQDTEQDSTKETTETEESAVELRKIVIQANDSSVKYRTGDVNIEESSTFVSVINVENFEGKIKDISEIVEDEASVQTRQLGGLGSFCAMSLRGSTNEQVLVFIDGVLLNDATGGGVDLSEISLSDIESIEIYRGATPAQFGIAAIGGVINIKTKRAEKGFSGSAGIGYGSYDTKKASLFVNHKLDKFDYVIIGDYLYSDNDYKFINDNQTPYNYDDDVEEKRENNELTQGSITAKAGYDFTKDIRVDIANQYFKKDRNLPGWDNSPEFETSYNTDRNITNAKFTINNIGAYKFNTALLAHYSYKKDIYDDRYNQVGHGEQHIEYLTTSRGANLFYEWPTEYNNLILVGSVNHEEMESTNLLQDSAFNYYPCQRTTYAGTSESTVTLFSKSLIIRPALRYHRIYDKTGSGQSFDDMETEIEGSSSSRGSFSPQLGIKYKALEWLILKTNLVRYTRDPSIFELHGDRGHIKGDPYLDSEKGTNFDIGAEINRKFDRKQINRINYSLAYFYSRVENTIVPNYYRAGFVEYTNADSVVYGIENSLSFIFYKHFTLIGNITWQNSKNLDKGYNDVYYGNQLPGIFELSTFSKIEFKYEFFKLFCEYRFEHDMYYDTANLIPAEDKKELNAGISVIIYDARLTFEIKNITDNRYEDFPTIPAPGRSYNGAVKYSF